MQTSTPVTNSKPVINWLKSNTILLIILAVMMVLPFIVAVLDGPGQWRDFSAVRTTAYR